MAATVVLVGTFDTKGIEFDFVQKQIDHDGTCVVLLIDIGLQSNSKTLPSADISSVSVIQAAGGDLRVLQDPTTKKSDLFDLMTKGLSVKLNELYQSNRLHGLLTLGGSCGTAIVSKAIEESPVLPIGLPKLFVSTMAGSSNAHTFFGSTDVSLMHSVTDMGGGLNRINEPILANAAVAIAAMASRFHSSSVRLEETATDAAPLIALTMFGVTTPCVMEAKQQLEKLGYATVLFHATGTGGRTMERLIGSGVIHGVLDITTTELADELVGGILSAGPKRLQMAGQRAVPQVISLGALDMVNFGSRDTVPAHFAKDRLLHEHNAQVTLMRTNEDECAQLGEIIAKKLNQQTRSNPVQLFVPRGGFSALSGTNIFTTMITFRSMFVL